MSMLQPGMIDMTRTERIALDQLLVKLGEPKVRLSRRDPGDAGPLLVKLDDATYVVFPDGRVEKATD